MATLILSAAGAALGASVGGSVLGVSAAVIGRAVGATIGNAIDQKVFGFGAQSVETGRIDKFRLQNTGEGAGIPLIQGAMRVGGQMIWSSDYKETVTQTSSGGKGGGPEVTTTSYSYSVSVAIALGEGPIRRIGRVWADGSEMNLDEVSYTLYPGDQSQLPDPLISADQGIENTPAFRGTAYVVIEDLPLGNFGNRLPQLNFEVFRKPQVEIGVDAADLVRGVCLIPGTGEYSLSTQPVSFEREFADIEVVNQNNSRAVPDFLASIEDLQTDLPNNESVSLVVSWFGNDLRCQQCSIQPMVEQAETDGSPMPWSVSGTDRANAATVSELNERPVFGGTPSDASVVEAIQHLKSIGQRAVFYPFILMDIQEGNALPNPWGGTSQPVMPWRGRITLNDAPGQPASNDKTIGARVEVDAFFGTAAPNDFVTTNGTVEYKGPQEWSYRRFILHYANLCALAGDVDIFCIGSEMRSLTQIRDSSDGFPAVAQLKALAADVRGILGAGTKITYAADWSEYFGYQPQDGSGDVLFHLDPLWADSNVDYIGVDNYMPIADWREGPDHADAAVGSIYDQEYLQENIEGGEGYDWFYASSEDRENQLRSPIVDGAYNEDWVFRFKDFRNWWQNPHYNRIAGVRSAVSTDWAPESKPFVFTEFGCPAVDKGPNQPNVFIDPKSSESFAPYYSDTNSDPVVQAQYLKAVQQYWEAPENNPVSSVTSQPMIDMSNAHLWAWDARPWPDFPYRLDFWSDGENYGRGHWFSGRAANADLAQVVAEICERAGLHQFDVSRLYGRVAGYSVQTVETARASLQPLMAAYGFACREVDGVVEFFMYGNGNPTSFSQSDFVSEGGENSAIENLRDAAEAVNERISVSFVDAGRNYQAGEAEILPLGADAARASAVELPVVLEGPKAKSLAKSVLAAKSHAKEGLRFRLPQSRLDITAGDVFSIEGAETRYRVDEIEEGLFRSLRATRIDTRTSAPVEETDLPVRTGAATRSQAVYATLLDIPILQATDKPHAPYLAATSKPWPGGVSVYASAENDDFKFFGSVEAPSVFARSTHDLLKREPNLWARQSLEVLSSSTELLGKSEIAVFNGANAFAIRHDTIEDVEIVQFRDVSFGAGGSLVMSHLLRGQLGTDGVMPDIWPAGSELILLDDTLRQIDFPQHLLGLDLNFRIGPSNQSYDASSYQTVTREIYGIGLRPYAPVHLKVRKNEDGDCAFDWVRRTRLNGDTWQGMDVPVSEASEVYLVEITAGGQLIREESTPVSEWTYLATDQINDFGGGTFEFSVCQVSDTYGCGVKSRMEVND